MSYAQIADLAGISRSGFYKVLYGEREPGFDNIARISDALGIHPSKLLVADGETTERVIEPLEALEIIRKALEKGQR